MNPFVTVTIGFIAIGAAVNAANNCTTINTLQLTGVCGAKHFFSYLTDAGNTHFIVDGVSERTCICLGYIQNPRPVLVILELEVFLVEGRTVFIQFAAQNPQGGMT